ncbi:hypothetical protein pb186bvf_010902 [Paramecium bursaria]
MIIILFSCFRNLNRKQDKISSYFYNILRIIMFFKIIKEINNEQASFCNFTCCLDGSIIGYVISLFIFYFPFIRYISQNNLYNYIGSATKRVQAKELSTEERHAPPHPHGPPHHPPPSSEGEEGEEESELHNESESEYSEEIVAHHAQRKNHFASHYAEAAATAATPATPAKAATAFGEILIGAVLALVLYIQNFAKEKKQKILRENFTLQMMHSLVVIIWEQDFYFCLGHMVETNNILIILDQSNQQTYLISNLLFFQILLDSPKQIRYQKRQYKQYIRIKEIATVMLIFINYTKIINFLLKYNIFPHYLYNLIGYNQLVLNHNINNILMMTKLLLGILLIAALDQSSQSRIRINQVINRELFE